MVTALITFAFMLVCCVGGYHVGKGQKLIITCFDDLHKHLEPNVFHYYQQQMKGHIEVKTFEELSNVLTRPSYRELVQERMEHHARGYDSGKDDLLAELQGFVNEKCSKPSV